MNSSLKTSNNVLLEYLQNIFEIPERINNLDITVLKELLIFIENDKFQRLKSINGVLTTTENYNYPKQYQPNKHFEYWSNTITQYGMCYFDILNLEKLIKEKLINLSQSKDIKRKEPLFNSEVFSNLESERFFYYVVNEWIKDKKEPLVYVSYLFRQLSNKEKENTETIIKDYSIHCTQPIFINFCNRELKLKNTIDKIKTYYEIGHKPNKESVIRTLLETFKKTGVK